MNYNFGSVAVIIPTYNAANQIEMLLEMLSRQTVKHNLLIIDSESDDATPSILRQKNINYISMPKREFDHGRTRNLGLKYVNAEWVVFMTQDALPESDSTLETLLLAGKQRDDIALVYGRQLPYPNTGVFGRLARELHYPANSIIKDKSLIPILGIRTCSCSNSFAAYKVTEFIAASCFPSDTILGEDVTLAAKLILSNKAVAYCSEARVYHAHDYTVAEEFGRYFDIGVFHQQQRALLEPFTKAEGEGLSYALKETELLLKEKKIYLLPEQLIRLFVKYFAYKLGSVHRWLPAAFKRRISMHTGFWVNGK